MTLEIVDSNSSYDTYETEHVCCISYTHYHDICGSLVFWLLNQKLRVIFNYSITPRPVPQLTLTMAAVTMLVEATPIDIQITDK